MRTRRPWGVDIGFATSVGRRRCRCKCGREWPRKSTVPASQRMANPVLSSSTRPNSSPSWTTTCTRSMRTRCSSPTWKTTNGSVGVPPSPIVATPVRFHNSSFPNQAPALLHSQLRTHSALCCTVMLAPTQPRLIEVRCVCGVEFCFNCGAEPHSPASCRMVAKWALKVQEESGTADWIAENVKDCPKCSAPVHKSGGCHHIVCHCGQAFCWVRNAILFHCFNPPFVAPRPDQTRPDQSSNSFIPH